MNTILSDDGSEFVRFRIINNSILINVTSQMYDQLNFGLGTTSAIETEIAGNEVFLKIELPVLSDTTSTKLPDIVKLNLIVETLSLLTTKIARVYKNLKVE